jgi:hypothetical protein
VTSPITQVLKLVEQIREKSNPDSGAINSGKKRKDLVSYNMLTEAYQGLQMLEQAEITGHHLSADLSVRYLSEVHQDFIYLFVKNQAKQQELCNGYIYFGTYQQKRALEDDTQADSKRRWKELSGNTKPSNSNHWSGKKRSEIAGQEMNKIYKKLSLFAHPGIFSLERSEYKTSKIYPTFYKLGLHYGPYLVLEIYDHAINLGLYGVRKNVPDKTRNLISSMLKEHPAPDV